MKITIDVEIPNGFDYVRFGTPTIGDNRIILRKSWEPPANAAKGLTFYPLDGNWFVTTDTIRQVGLRGWAAAFNALKANLFTTPPEQRLYTL